MSTDRDVDRIVRSWLEAGATALPERVLDDVLDRLPATPQRRAWRPTWRLYQMPTFIRVALAATVIGAAGVFGLVVLPRTTDTSGPAAEASPSPQPTPMALSPGKAGPGRYRWTPFAEPNDVGMCWRPPQPGCSEAPDDDSIRATITVPPGWSGAPFNSIWIEQNSAPSGAGLILVRGGWQHTDPCTTAESGPPDVEVGPSVGDFVAALTSHPALDTSVPRDVSLAGYTGKYLDLQLPLDITGCGYFPWEPALYAQGPGHQWHLWVLDVDGTRVVVQARDYATTSPKTRDELAAMVASLGFDRVPDTTAPVATSTGSGAP